MDVEWFDLAFPISRGRSRERNILAPCSGNVSKDRMLCVMGLSGSGKTTFLNCILGMIEHDGDVRFNGMLLGPVVRQTIAHLEQGEAIRVQMSVREALRFLAEMRYGIFSKKAKDKIAEVLTIVCLHHAVDRFCDTLCEAEQKLVCLARALVADPLLLICDESLSGLESAIACNVLDGIRGYCASGNKNLIMAVKETSSFMLERFDDLILLGRGETLYNGPVSRVEAVFEKCGLHRSPSEGLAEYLLDTLCSEASKESTWCTLKDVAREYVTDSCSLSGLQASSFHHRYRAPMRRQLILLSRRFFTRSVVGILAKTQILVQLADIGLAGVLFWDLTREERGLNERYTAVNWVLGHWTMGAVFRGIQDLSWEWDIVSKELRLGCYSLQSYYFARVWLTLPLDLVYIVTWNTVLCWISKLTPSLGSLIYFQVVVCFSYSCYHSIGLCISATRPGIKLAMMYGFLLVSYSLTWSAFYADLDRSPWYFNWIRHSNILQYGVVLSIDSLLISSEYSPGLEFTCDAADANTIFCKKQHDGTWRLSSWGARERLKLNYDVPTCLVVLGSVVLIFRVFLMYGLLYKAFSGVLRSRASHIAAQGSPYAISGPRLGSPRQSLTKRSSKQKNEQEGSRRDSKDEILSRDSKAASLWESLQKSEERYDSEGIELASLRPGATRQVIE